LPVAGRIAEIIVGVGRPDQDGLARDLDKAPAVWRPVAIDRAAQKRLDRLRLAPDEMLDLGELDDDMPMERNRCFLVFKLRRHAVGEIFRAGHDPAKLGLADPLRSFQDRHHIELASGMADPPDRGDQELRPGRFMVIVIRRSARLEPAMEPVNAVSFQAREPFARSMKAAASAGIPMAASVVSREKRGEYRRCR
jgi:hypothetical protein